MLFLNARAGERKAKLCWGGGVNHLSDLIIKMKLRLKRGCKGKHELFMVAEWQKQQKLKKTSLSFNDWDCSNIFN